MRSVLVRKMFRVLISLEKEKKVALRKKKKKLDSNADEKKNPHLCKIPAL